MDSHKWFQAQRLEYCYECINFRNRCFVWIYSYPSSVYGQVTTNVIKSGRRWSFILNLTKIQRVWTKSNDELTFFGSKIFYNKKLFPFLILFSLNIPLCTTTEKQDFTIWTGFPFKLTKHLSWFLVKVLVVKIP